MYLDSELKEIKIELAVTGKRGEWEYIINEDNTITLTSYKKEIKNHLDIPNVVEDHLVSGLGDDLFNYATKMTSMTLPEGIKTIGARTFAFCSNLEWKVEFPNSLESVGEQAFYGCSKITGNLDEIMSLEVTYGKGVFMKCSALTGNIQTLIDMLDESETVIGESLFSGFSGATGKLIIPERITKIEANAFYGCSGIEGIEFESNSNLTSIGDSAFYQCSNMGGTLDIPDSVTTIEGKAFYEDKKISGLNLPTNLSSLGTYAFYYCEGIKGTVTFPCNLNKIEKSAFNNCKNINKIVFEKSGNKGISIIGEHAFYRCDKIQSIEFPNTLTEIQLWAFYGDNYLGEIYLPDSLEKIGNTAFNGCENLNITHWSNKLNTIGDGAFSGSKNLKTLPDITKLNTIGESAFSGCTLLGTSGENNIIKWLENSNIESIGESCFKDCENLTGDYTGEVYNKKGVKIKISGSPFIGTKINLVATLDLEGKTTINNNQYAGVTKFVDNAGNEITQINIPNTITSIGSYAFSGCTSITKVTIPDTVANIGDGCFKNCTNLAEINLPNNSNYTTMSQSLLNGCINLKNIKIPNNITTISSYALCSCGFTELEIPSNVKEIALFGLANNYSLTKLTLNEGLESIGSQFIRASKITKLEIPNSVTNLEGAVLHYCQELKTLIIGKGVTKIPERMLWSTNYVESITIKGKITEIGAEAFNDSYKLKTLNMDWSNITKIDSKAFRNCSLLQGNIKLNPLCSIAVDAFEGCSLNITK